MVLFPGEHGCHAYGPLNLCPETPLLGDVSSCDCCCVIRARILASGRQGEEGGEVSVTATPGTHEENLYYPSQQILAQRPGFTQRERQAVLLTGRRTFLLNVNQDLIAQDPVLTASRRQKKGATCPLHHHGVHTALAPLGHSHGAHWQLIHSLIRVGSPGSRI